MSTGKIRGNMKECTMEFISTTATAVEKLQRQAKTLSKATGTPLRAAQTIVAQHNGYAHWKHVTDCRAQTVALSQKKPLPAALHSVLDRAAERQPASVASQTAFAHGFVFAMDVKDAQELSLGTDYAECEDGWYLAAGDLWQALAYHRDEETGTVLADIQAPEDLVRTALDDMQNYRLYRYLGAVIPTLKEAHDRIQKLSFFPPTHLWLSGKFIDFSEGSDGQRGDSAAPGVKVQPAKKRTRLERFGHLLNESERALFGKMTQQEQEFWLHQLAKKTPIGKIRYKPVDVSLRVSWGATKSVQT